MAVRHRRNHGRIEDEKPPALCAMALANHLDMIVLVVHLKVGRAHPHLVRYLRMDSPLPPFCLIGSWELQPEWSGCWGLLLFGARAPECDQDQQSDGQNQKILRLSQDGNDPVAESEPGHQPAKHCQRDRPEIVCPAVHSSTTAEFIDT